MNILFDYYSTQPYGEVKNHGGGEYGKTVLRYIYEYISISENIKNIELFLLVNKKVELETEFKRHSRQTIIKIENYSNLKNIIVENGINILYSPVPYFLAKHKYLKDFSNLKIRGTIFGLRNLEILDDKETRYYRYGTKAFFKMVLKRILIQRYESREKEIIDNLIDLFNGNILTMTMHTKYMLKSVFNNIKPSHIKTAYALPISNSSQIKLICEDVFLKWGLERKKYFIFVGSNRLEKNAIRTIKAINKNLKDINDYKFIFLGVSKQFNHKVSNLVKANNKIIFFSYVDNNTYECLMKNAFCLLYPSLSEGFGYPPFEAIKYNVPIIASSITSIPEVYKDHVLYTNPYSINEISSRIYQMIYEKSFRNELIKKSDDCFKNLVKKAEEDKKVILDYIFFS